MNQPLLTKIPVTSDYNQMIFDAVMVGNDFLDCSKQTWRRLEFQLKNAKGSFSIIFSQMNPTM